MKRFDVVVVGAGAAGMMCAAVAGQRGKQVLLIDHASKLAEKIRISGGGRCNFTNRHTTPAQYFSENPRFCHSALSQFRPKDFIDLVKRYRIPFHEKHKGQLFCDESSHAIIDLLCSECECGHVEWRKPCKVYAVRKETRETGECFVLDIDGGPVEATRLVIATGGLSIPQIGATDWGIRLAREWNIPVVAPRPALVPLLFENTTWAPFAPMAGMALEVDVFCKVGKERVTFREDLLFTHRGLSGPAILQISTVWQQGASIVVNLVPDVQLEEQLLKEKTLSRQQMSTILAQWLPRRLAQEWATTLNQTDLSSRKIAEVPDKTLRNLAHTLNKWELFPKGSEGYKKAEVMRGGIDTRALHQHSMEVKAVAGLHFIGEVVDVTGWLGGYNFQWAWASGVAAGRAI